MRLARLHIENLRNIEQVELAPSPGFQLFTGANGAGKTSILEAVYLLAHAQSFRPAKPDWLGRTGTRRWGMAATVESIAGTSRISLAREDGRWDPRVDREPATRVGELLQVLSVVSFDPGAHCLVSGSNQERRRFLDWGVFHVEHDFLGISLRYRKALQQRNAALKRGSGDRELLAWELEMAEAAVPLTRLREDYFARLTVHAQGLLHRFVNELAHAAPHFNRGWPADVDLAESLAASRGIDRERGHTGRGPHRAHWSLRFPGHAQPGQLSRGQEKLCALAFVLAKALLHREAAGEWPVVCLDDLASELDREHQRQVIQFLVEAGADQVWMSGVEIPECVAGVARRRVFHVEHGKVRELL